MKRILIILLPLLITAGCPQPPIQHTPPRHEPVKQVEPEFTSEFDRLVWLLGSENFDKRREAHGRLFAMGREIVPALEEAAAKTKNKDHKRQIELIIADLGVRKDQREKKDLLVVLAIGGKSFEAGNQVQVTLEIRNTGNVPLELTAPLLRKHSLTFRLDWIADMTFLSQGREQRMEATGTKRDELLEEGWTPTTVSVEPGKSIREEIDISDLCLHPARYTAVAAYRWAGVGDFMSNSVSFEVKKPPASPEKPDKNDGDK